MLVLAGFPIVCGTNTKVVTVSTLLGYKRLTVEADVLPKPIEMVPAVARIFLPADAPGASVMVGITNALETGAACQWSNRYHLERAGQHWQKHQERLLSRERIESLPKSCPD
jgi:hypothetical protein